MIPTSSNADSIAISKELPHKFDLIYPDHLNGIISEAEYQKSITNINSSTIVSWKFFTHSFYFIYFEHTDCMHSDI